MKPDQLAPIAPSAIRNVNMARPAPYSGQMKNQLSLDNHLEHQVQTAAIQAIQS
jgi:hypothetical protein